MYPNKGSWETGGVNWFINGDKKNLNASNDESFPGFFCQVFSKKDVVATDTYNMSKKNFNDWMKDAFRNHKAIGFSVYGFSNTNEGLHAMTVWGLNLMRKEMWLTCIFMIIIPQKMNPTMRLSGVLK